MKDLVWLLGFASASLFGLALWRLRGVAALDLGARIAVAFAGGAVFTAALMFLFSVAGIEWSRVTIGVPLTAVAVAALWWRRGGINPSASEGAGGNGSGRTFGVVLAVILLITLYGIATARETCGDLLYFWGPKAQAFAAAGKLDAQFLGWQHHYLMHPDYPPLMPLIEAWASIVAHRFSWWGALLTMPLLLLLAALALRGFARGRLGPARAGWFAMLLAALLAHTFAVGMVAGGGDPLLVFFETVAVAALTFDDSRDTHLVAALALAGAAWTKVEGAAFVVVVLLAYAIARRCLRPLLLLAAPAALLLGAWIAFIRYEHLVDQYGRAGEKLHLQLLGGVLTQIARYVDYKSWYLPWVAVLAPLAFGRNWLRAAFPLLVAGGTFASAVYFYLHNPDPWWWISSSAERVFLTPLACLAVAAAAASE
jgi:hypothetical protein